MTSSCVAFESVGLNVHPSAILSSSALRIDLTYLSPVLDSRPNESMNHSFGGTVRTSPADRSGSMCKPFSCLRSRSSVRPLLHEVLHPVHAPALPGVDPRADREGLLGDLRLESLLGVPFRCELLLVVQSGVKRVSLLLRQLRRAFLGHLRRVLLVLAPHPNEKDRNAGMDPDFLADPSLAVRCDGIFAPTTRTSSWVDRSSGRSACRRCPGTCFGCCPGRMTPRWSWRRSCPSPP